MHVKRWICLGFLGLLLFMVGAGVIIQAHAPLDRPLVIRVADWLIDNAHIGLRPGLLGLTLTVVGAIVCLFALARLINSLTSVLDPEIAPGGLVEVVYRHRKLAQGRRIVVIGGGTGLSTMLRGLKRFTGNITAIVTVTDDGGSSGKLTRQLNILPAGDIRNCLVALADSEPQMTELFQYRFRTAVPVAAGSAPVADAGGFGEGLRDHAFGNLLIAAMCAINGGDFQRAIHETSRVLNIRGRVLPTTVSHVRLRAEMEDGSTVDGETNIATSPKKIRRISLVPSDACPAEDVIESILAADLIVMGPGSVFTSITPNLLVSGIPEAIRRSRAKKIYVCNVMTQKGETDGFSAYDHIRAIEWHARQRVFHHVLVNTGRPSQELLEKYRRAGSVLVEADIDRIKADGYHPVAGDYISQTDVVRHDAGLLADAIMKLLE
jgi:uncharacterized cofD-like protein